MSTEDYMSPEAVIARAIRRRGEIFDEFRLLATESSWRCSRPRRGFSSRTSPTKVRRRRVYAKARPSMPQELADLTRGTREKMAQVIRQAGITGE